MLPYLELRSDPCTKVVLRQSGVKLIDHWLQRLAYCRLWRTSF